MTRYQLLEGEHIEPDDTEAGRKIRRGDTFESKNDQYAAKWPEKFKKLDGTSDLSRTWNPQLESLEAFTERMKSLQGNQAQNNANPQSIKTAPVLTEDDGTMQTLESMTIKELQAHASQQGINLQGATRKEDILRIFKGALLSAE